MGGGLGVLTNTNTNNSSSNNSNRTFVDFSIYKSKSALSVKLVKPTFETDSQGRTIMKRSAGSCWNLGRKYTLDSERVVHALSD